MDELNNHLDMAEERIGELEDLKEFYPEKQLENMKTKSRDTREPALCVAGVSGDGATYLVIEARSQTGQAHVWTRCSGTAGRLGGPGSCPSWMATVDLTLE